MAKGNTKTKKEFAPNIGFWPTRKGNGFTAVVTAETRKELERFITEATEGRRLYLGEVNSDNERAPAMRLSVLPEDNAAENNDSI